MKYKKELTGEWILREKESGEAFRIPGMPMQVHEILYENGRIDDGYLWGKTGNCGWVNDRTWSYETEFECEEAAAALLLFEGLDTICSIWLNGKKIGESRDCYLPCCISADGYLRSGKNRLEVVFEPVRRELERIREARAKLPEQERVQPERFIRKTFHDFTTYLGNDPDFYKVGIFRPVSLIVLPEKLMLAEVQTGYTLNEALDRAQVRITPVLYQAEKISHEVLQQVRVTVQISLDGEVLWQASGEAGESFHASLDGIRLWWPRGYGEQPLYEISAEVSCCGCLAGDVREDYAALLDEAGACGKNGDRDRIADGNGEAAQESRIPADRKAQFIGFRKIQMQGMFDFSVNGVQVKLWGANLTPDQGHTLCEDTERIERLLKLAVDGNVNTLRLWGEGVPFTEFLYDYADRHGILLWQEFFCGHAQYPTCHEVTELILREAEWMIRNLGHHPSILLWCGGNECYLSRDFAAPDEEYLAAPFFEYELKELCSRLDPDRYYHVSSPFFGTYSNDPALGDTHSYTNSWYVPGGDYPVFATENLRVCFPGEKSLKRYLQTDELPAPGQQKHGGLPWPEEYERITSAESWKKIPPVEQFYDAGTPEEMIYRFGMAAGLYIKDAVERYRRGKRTEEAFAARRCMGHLIWKWNTTFPHIYSSMIDAYLEPKMPYYFLKRAYEPTAISIEVSDHIDVWAVNDTAQTLQGTAVVSLFDMQKNRYVQNGHFPFRILPGESRMLGRLDSWGQMTRDKIVYGELRDDQGQILARNHSYLDIERHMTFPEAKVEMHQEGDVLVLMTDRYARCVELSGEDRGDAYWWDFSDNYFDLFPGEEKRIGILGKHTEGTVRAKAFYSPYTAELLYRK